MDTTGRDASYQGHVFYHFTPANPSFSDPKMKGENGSENQFQTDPIGRMLLMDNMWTSIPCSDLLALADAAIVTKGSGGGCGGGIGSLGDGGCGSGIGSLGGGACGNGIGTLSGGGDDGDHELNLRFHDPNDGNNLMPDTQQYGQPDRMKYLFDLNSPPAVTEPPPPQSISTELTPPTPKRTRKPMRKRVVSDIIKSNTNEKPKSQVAINLEQSYDDIWQLELDEDLEEGSSDDLSLEKTPNTKPKRRKHRPKVVVEGQPKTAKKSTSPKTNAGSTGKRKYTTLEKSTPNEPTRQTRNSCRRKINFEEEHIYDTPLGPITPEKPETKTGIKNPSSRAKRNINLSRNDDDNDKDAAGYISSRNDHTCSSTSAWFKDAFGIPYDSLDEYLSNLPPICKRKRSKTSRRSRVFDVNNQHSNKQISAFGHFESFRKQRSKSLKRVRDLGSFVGIIQSKRYSCIETLAAADLSIHIATKKRTKRNFMLPSSSYYNHYFLTNHIGFYSGLRWKNTYDIKALMNQLECLGINDRKVEENRYALVPYLTRYREKNGLVLYQKDRSLVPFEDFYDEMNSRKARPKVDLDDETSRVWRLLLEDINSQGIDGTDEDSAKRWEEERSVFSGRATSFIARMHLVQGDRRFSCWKGSVVDSVIGVFLTQNVSDHLSSSAFMNIAARYPLKSKNSNEPIHEDNSSIYVKESCQLDIEETITWHENNSNQQLTQDHGSMTLQDADSYEKEVVSSNESSRINNSFASTMINEVDSQDQPNESKSEDIGYIDMREEITITHKKDEEKCASEQSEISAESAVPDTVEIVNTEILECQMVSENSEVIESNSNEDGNFQKSASGIDEVSTQIKKGKTRKVKKTKVDWDSLRRSAQMKKKRERTPNTMDSVDYEAVRCADVDEIAETIKDRGMNNMLAERIKNFLNRLVKDHGSIDLEWLRDVPPDKAKEYLLSFRGLGLKSVECVRLLTLHHLAFPVDTNVGRIAVRLGWVPLQPLPESLQLHLLELYPVLESIQKYLWPRLCKLDQRTLYELHYQMITFGKVFCTKNKPNCNSCPMRGECRHFASAFASARLALPAPEEKNNKKHGQNLSLTTNEHQLTLPPTNHYLQQNFETQNHEPVIEEPATPEPEKIQQEYDIEDFCEENEEIPIIRLNMEAFTQNLQNYMENNMELAEGDMSRALVALTSETASIPTRKLKNVSQLRTEHHVYELPDSHPLLEGLDKREPDDPCSYLLAIWTPGETAESIQPPQGQCSSQESGTLCHQETCFLCNSIREANSQTVRGTLLIPCRTAMRGSFPLNGTYFQVNEVFADHDSSLNPIDVPRSWLWNLPRRTVYFGTSIPTIFRGLTTEGIQYCFWRGFVCVRGFDQKTRAPRPLMARLHFPASKLKGSRWKNDEN